MEVIYDSNFKFRSLFYAVFLIFLTIIIQVLVYGSVDRQEMLISTFVGIGFFVISLVYGLKHPDFVADDILMTSNGNNRIFTSQKSLESIVSLANHYGFIRMIGYQEIMENGELKLVRKSEYSEGIRAAELVIWKSSNGNVRARLCLKNKMFPQITPSNDLYNFSLDLKQFLA